MRRGKEVPDNAHVDERHVEQVGSARSLSVRLMSRAMTLLPTMPHTKVHSHEGHHQRHPM